MRGCAAQAPSLNPTGTELVYLSDSGGHGNLWIVGTDGSGLRQLTFERDPNLVVGLGTPVEVSGDVGPGSHSAERLEVGLPVRAQQQAIRLERRRQLKLVHPASIPQPSEARCGASSDTSMPARMSPAPMVSSFLDTHSSVIRSDEFSPKPGQSR